MLIICLYYLLARLWSAQWNGCTRSDPKGRPAEDRLSAQSGDTVEDTVNKKNFCSPSTPEFMALFCLPPNLSLL